MWNFIFNKESNKMMRNLVSNPIGRFNFLRTDEKKKKMENVMRQ